MFLAVTNKAIDKNRYLVFDDTDSTLGWASSLELCALKAKGYSIKVVDNYSTIMSIFDKPHDSEFNSPEAFTPSVIKLLDLIGVPSYGRDLLMCDVQFDAWCCFFIIVHDKAVKSLCDLVVFGRNIVTNKLGVCFYRDAVTGSRFCLSDLRCSLCDIWFYLNNKQFFIKITKWGFKFDV